MAGLAVTLWLTIYTYDCARNSESYRDAQTDPAFLVSKIIRSFGRVWPRFIETEPDMVLVGQATNGVEAIAEFRRHRPDITLMDLRLPVTNDTDILIAIRGEFPDARIIMLSSSDSDGEIQRALRSGACHFGLRGMRERAERINAKFTLVSSPNSGTVITLVVPGHVAFHN